MSEPDQDKPILEGRELLIAVRRILVENPERHEQEEWLGNFYLTRDELIDGIKLMLPLDQIRPYALRPITQQPEQPGATWPVCGSTGCIAGWAVVLSAPPGSFLQGCRLTLPSGDSWALDRWAATRIGITPRQAAHLFSPYRTRDRLIRILDALIEDPSAEVTLVE